MAPDYYPCGRKINFIEILFGFTTPAKVSGLFFPVLSEVFKKYPSLTKQKINTSVKENDLCPIAFFNPVFLNLSNHARDYFPSSHPLPLAGRITLPANPIANMCFGVGCEHTGSLADGSGHGLRECRSFYHQILLRKNEN